MANMRGLGVGQFHRQLNRGLHAVWAGDVFAGNVKRGSMVWTGAHNRQTNGDIHGAVKPQQFYGNQTLVVVHGHHQIPFARGRVDKNGVARKWSAHINAVASGYFNGGRDHALLLIAKQTMLARVRI